MKLPSLQSLWDETLAVFRRFPLQVLITIAAVVILMMQIDNQNFDDFGKLVAALNFSFTLLLSADLFAESHEWSSKRKWVLRLGVLVCCGLLYLTLEPRLFDADLLRIALFTFAFHLLVSFAPFVGTGTTIGFWNYNQRLFLHMITAVIFAGVLTAGLFVAVSASKVLFGLELYERPYAYIASLTMVGFLTIFFLSGIPKHLRSLDEQSQDYPKGLKVFTQYVLIPLLSIYLAILLVYEVKILIKWQLPKGYVSTLVLGYAVAGILSLLLIHPIRNREGNSWMGVFSRFFYVMMIPLVVLLLLAVWKRVSVYGITEPRYILILLALWLTIVTVYSLASKHQNIRFIPVSLCILALLAVYGPQSAFSVSKYSQINRLEQMMKQNTAAAKEQRADIIEYLVKNHGILSLQSFTERNLQPLQLSFAKQMSKAKWKYDLLSIQVDTALVILKVQKNMPRRPNTQEMYFHAGKSISISGYDYLIPVETYVSEDTLNVHGYTLMFRRPAELQIEVSIGTETQTIDISPITQRLLAELSAGKLKKEDQPESYIPAYELPLTGMDIPLQNMLFSGVFRVTSVDVKDPSEPKRGDFAGYFLLRLKTSK